MDQYKRVEVLEHRSSLLLRAIRLSDGAEVAIERVKAGFEWAMAVGDARGEAALAWAAARTTLCHAHVAPLLDALRDDNDLCFVTPLVRPGSRVFEGAALPLTPAAVAHAGYQLVSAVAYLHAQAPPLLHCNICAAALRLTAAPEAAPIPREPLTPAQASELVVGGALVLCHDFKCIAPLVFGQVFNRPRFLAPERLLEDEFSTPADVWALGATLLQLATGHVAGGTSAARKTLVGFGDAPWTPHKALAGAYHDKFGGAEDEAGWSEACAAQRAAWDALGAPLRSLIEACLVLEPGGRATAADLLAHAAFEGVRGAPLVAAEGPQLEQHGGGGGGGGGASVVLHAAAAVGASAEALRSEAAAHTAQQQAGFSHHPALEAFVADLAACSALFVDDRHEPAPALPHCLFMGPPGTGKTTSARCLGRLLKDRGLLPLDDVVETTGWGLMGRFVGQTRGVVKALLQRALGGVLLIVRCLCKASLRYAWLRAYSSSRHHLPRPTPHLAPANAALTRTRRTASPRGGSLRQRRGVRSWA